MPPSTRRAWLSAGFHTALGVAIALLVLWVTYRVFQAAFAVITPFVVSIALALLLDPLINRVQSGARWTRGRRQPAVLTVSVVFLLAFGALAFLLVPSLIAQAGKLAQRAPEYFDTLRQSLNTWLAGHRQIAGIPLPSNTDALIARYSEQVSSALRASVGHIAGVLAGSVGGLLSVVLVPIITLYLLSDFDRLRARAFFLLPESVRAPARRTARDIGDVFGGYVRGLLIVCLAYAVTAVIALFVLSFWVPGLRAYALLLGVAAGLLYAVPYVGALVTLLLTLVVTLATGGGTGGLIAAVVTLVVLNQLFDNVVMPRVVGGGVGLHPIVSLFALLLGGNLFGLWGLLLSVPIAGSIQAVLYRLFPRLAAPTPLILGRSDEEIAEQRAAAGPPASQ